ncbi:hypothetical protein X801_07269, partial [Opisthorchis viverrini]
MARQQAPVICQATLGRRSLELQLTFAADETSREETQVDRPGFLHNWDCSSRRKDVAPTFGRLSCHDMTLNYVQTPHLVALRQLSELLFDIVPTTVFQNLDGRPTTHANRTDSATETQAENSDVEMDDLERVVILPDRPASREFAVMQSLDLGESHVDGGVGTRSIP